METYVNYDDLMDVARGSGAFLDVRGLVNMDLVQKIDIVKCKECFQRRKDGYCSLFTVRVPDDFFCACGELNTV